MTDQWLVRKLLEQDKKIEALSRGGTGVGHTSIAPGEALTVLSEDGEVVLGAGGVEYVDGPTPATPSAPSLKLGFGTIEVTWDGSFAAGEDENGIPLVAPIDFDVVEVHCSTDPLEEEWGDDTRRGQIKTREGGTITVGGFDVDDEVFVCLIALAKTGKRSAPSATASLVIEGLDFSQLFNELDAANATIKNAGEILVTEQGTLDEKLTEVDGTLDNLGQDLDAVEAAQEALSGDLTDVMLSVDGKNTIKWDPAAPTSATPGKATGDMWYRTSGNSIIGFWKWSGSAWVAQLLDKTTIPLIDIGAGTFGTMSGSRLDANSVSASSIAVGDFSNLATIDPVRNVNVTRPVLWATETVGEYIKPKAASQNYLMFKDRTDTVPFGAGDSLRISFRAKADVAGCSGQIRLWAYQERADGSTSPQASAIGPTVAFGVVDTQHSVTFSLPADFGSALNMRSWIVGFISAPGSGTDLHNVGVRDLTVYRMSGNTLIQNGAITTDKLSANVLEVGNLKAGTAAINEAVVNKLWAEAVVAKMVTASEFIGENAILTGAVTAPKITASEELWAKIGEFVKIRAEQIQADAIDGMVITGAKVQSSATNPKSQMSTNGFESFAADGSRTFFADAVTGDVNMTGSFYSNHDGLPRVEIDNDDWASVGVLDPDTGSITYINGAGIRIGSSPENGFSIYHGSYIEVGGVTHKQAAAVESPGGGKGQLGLFDDGTVFIGSPQVGGASSGGRFHSFGTGQQSQVSWNPSGIERAKVSTFPDGKVQIFTKSTSGGPQALLDMNNGTVTLETPGTIDFNALGDVRVNVQASAGARFRVPAVWDVQASGSANVVVNSAGTLFRPSSSRRYKQEIEPAEQSPSILDIETRTWLDISAVKANASAREYLAEIGQGPLPREFQDVELDPERHFGAIAEEVHDLGLTHLVEYDFSGRPDALKYPMFGVALIPAVRELRDRITELETKLENS